jgi:tetratricopeptide (TPR) repeat protein
MRRALAVYLIAGSVLILGACGGNDRSDLKESSQKKYGTHDDAELDRIVFTPEKLSLKQAIKRYGTNLRNSPGEDSQMLTKAAQLASSEADNDAAELMLSEAISLDDKNALAYYLRGRVRCNAIFGKDSAAMEDLNKAISLGFRDAEVYLVLARLYDNARQPQKAIENLTTAINISPTDKNLYKARAVIYVSIGEKEKALEDYRTISKLEPESIVCYFQQGQVLESMKKFDEACAVYKRMLRLDERKSKVPLKAIAFKRLAVLRGASGNHKEAIAYLTEAAKFDVEDDEPLRMRGIEYMKMQQYDKALADFDEAIAIAPESGSNFSARADAYDKLGKPELAKRDRDEAKKWNEAPAERPMFKMK